MGVKYKIKNCFSDANSDKIKTSCENKQSIKENQNRKEIQRKNLFKISKDNLNQIEHEKEIVKSKYSTEINKFEKFMPNSKSSSTRYQEILCKNLTMSNMYANVERKVKNDILKHKLLKNGDDNQIKQAQINEKCTNCFCEPQRNANLFSTLNVQDVSNQTERINENINERSNSSESEISAIPFETDRTYVTFGNNTEKKCDQL